MIELIIAKAELDLAMWKLERYVNEMVDGMLS